MRKFLRLGVAALLAASGLMAVTTASSASIPVIPCPGPDVNPGVTVPPTVPPPLGGKELVGPEDPCADLVRTLVFVGVANITNGVNFAGTGNGTAAGGTFTFTGNLPDNPVGCAMVNWEDPDNSSAPADQPTITDCFFSLTNGTYTGPTQPNPIVNPIGRCIEFGAQLECAASPGTPGYTGLDWAPGSQASCFNSSGSGSSSFTSVGVDGTMEIWASNGPFTWENSLDNLRDRKSVV